MKTRSVDLAAYLHLCGIEPVEIKFVGPDRVRDYWYQQTPDVATAVRAFNDGAMVPAKAYAEARYEMKRRAHGGGRSAHNQRRAFEFALDQVHGVHQERRR